jgi:hypothetical protein
MNMHEHHEDLVQAFTDELKDVFDLSTQGVYLYLDDLHKSCNKKFANMLGYASPEVWGSTQESFPDLFVNSKSQNALVSAYQKAMEKGEASEVKVSWKKKSGGALNSTVILVPVSYRGHMFALHFVS